MTTALTPLDRARTSGLGVVTDLDTLAAAWLIGHGNERTRRAYLTDLRGYAAWLNGRDPLAATRVDADLYARALEGSCSPATVARKLSAIGGFYRYLVEEGVLERSPFGRVRRPALNSDSPTLGLERGELAGGLQRAESDARALALLSLLGLNGLRVSEALSADAEHLGESRGHRTLTVTRKGGRQAVLPLAPRTAEAIDRLLAGRKSGPLFATSTGRRLDRRAAHRIVRRYCGQGISPHSLRHAFVTIALDSGASLRDVQDAAGHADPRTTRRYDRGRYALDRNPTYAVAAAVN